MGPASRAAVLSYAGAGSGIIQGIPLKASSTRRGLWPCLRAAQSVGEVLEVGLSR